jgi:DNA-binding transcriptional regulator YdaS (Cro superfamily)
MYSVKLYTTDTIITLGDLHAPCPAAVASIVRELKECAQHSELARVRSDVEVTDLLGQGFLVFVVELNASYPMHVVAQSPVTLEYLCTCGFSERHGFPCCHFFAAMLRDDDRVQFWPGLVSEHYSCTDWKHLLSEPHFINRSGPIRRTEPLAQAVSDVDHLHFIPRQVKQALELGQAPKQLVRDTVETLQSMNEQALDLMRSAKALVQTSVNRANNPLQARDWEFVSPALIEQLDEVRNWPQLRLKALQLNLRELLDPVNRFCLARIGLLTTLGNQNRQARRKGRPRKDAAISLATATTGVNESDDEIDDEDVVHDSHQSSSVARRPRGNATKAQPSDRPQASHCVNAASAAEKACNMHDGPELYNRKTASTILSDTAGNIRNHSRAVKQSAEKSTAAASAEQTSMIAKATTGNAREICKRGQQRKVTSDIEETTESESTRTNTTARSSQKLGFFPKRRLMAASNALGANETYDDQVYTVLRCHATTYSSP